MGKQLLRDLRLRGVAPCTEAFPGASPAAQSTSPAPPPLEGQLGSVAAVMQLTNSQCRWPIGALNSDTFHFCARPVDLNDGSRYCAQHREESRQTGQRLLHQLIINRHEENSR